MEVINSLEELHEKNVRKVAYLDGKIVAFDRRDENISYEINVSLLDIYIYYYVDRNYLAMDQTLTDLFDEEFYRENAKELIDRLGCINYKMSDSKAIYEYCLENKLYKYLFQSMTFEEWFYDYVVGRENLDEGLDEEVNICLEEIVAMWDDDSQKNYAYSFCVAFHCLSTKRFDLLKNFHYSVFEYFSEEALVEYYDDLYALYDYVPTYLTKFKSYFDYLLEKGRIDLLVQFNSDFISEELYIKHENIFQKALLEAYYVPKGLKKNEKVREFLFKNKKFEKLLDMDIPPLISYFDDDEFYDCFLKSYKIGVSKHELEILEYFLNQGEYRFAFSNFDESLFTIELIEKYPEMLTNDDAFFFKNSFNFGFDVLEFYLKKEDIFDTPVGIFSNDVIDEAIDKYPNEMLALILENTRSFSTNVSALLLVLKNKKFNVLSSFSFDLIEGEILDTYGDGILNYLESLEYVASSFKTEAIFRYCITHNRFKLLSEFGDEFYTDEIIDKYGKDILIGFGNKFPLLFKNDRMFELSIECGFYELAISYNKITDTHIDKYFDELLKGMGGQASYILKSNDYFVKKCIDNDIPNLFEILNFNRITDELIQTHKDKVIELLSSNPENLGLGCSPAAFRFLIDNELYHLLDNLSWRACDEEYVRNHLDVMDELASLNLPQYLMNSTVYLKHCIDIGKKEYVMDFFHDNYDELDKKYVEKLSTMLTSPLSGGVALSKNILSYFLDKEDFTYIDEFRDACFGDSDNVFMEFYFMEEKNERYGLLQKYLVPLCKYSLNNGIPKPLKKSSLFFSVLLKNKVYSLVEQFEPCAVPFFLSTRDEEYQNIIEYIDEYNNGVVPGNFVTNESLRKVIFEDRRDDLLVQFVLNVKSDEMLKRYANILNFEYDEFKSKIDYLLSRNDELFNTVLPKMFEKRMNVIDFRHLEKIMLYPDLQYKLINMSDNQLIVMGKAFDFLDNDDYDYTGVIVSIIGNLRAYDSLIKDIDFSKMSKDEINRLLIVLSRKDNLYDINTVEELDTKIYKKKKKKYFSNILDKIKKGSVSLEELKIALLEKKFGLSMEQVSFLVERYCHSWDSLKNSKFDHKKYIILKEIDRIYNCNDLTLLKYLYIKSETVQIDLQTVISLESSIRQEFAKLYSDSLYKLNSEHKVECDSKLKEENSQVYDLLSGLTYKDKHIPVYIMDGDFRLQIHALGAYREWSRPDNFKQDWERPKIAYHGICTSYIANNQIANARAFHPILGFDNYSSNSLLCAGNYDLFSDYAINRYDVSMYLPYKFFLPDDMIDNTRHTHNEMVIERRGNCKGATYKRLPNYVVMLVDDINNLNNYNNELWDEYCQAAHDYDVPIVIVDRLKYAKFERNKISQLEEVFSTTYDERSLEQIILQFSNNMIGCACYDQNNVCEYNRIFSLDAFSDLVSKLIDTILNIKNEKLRLKLIKLLYVNLCRERDKGGLIPSIEGITKILESANVSLKVDEENVVSSFENERIINEYYYNASEDIQRLIEEDLNNNVDLDIIVNNIKFGVYERRFKL